MKLRKHTFIYGADIISSQINIYTLEIIKQKKEENILKKRKKSTNYYYYLHILKFMAFS